MGNEVLPASDGKPDLGAGDAAEHHADHLPKLLVDLDFRVRRVGGMPVQVPAIIAVIAARARSVAEIAEDLLTAAPGAGGKVHHLVQLLVLGGFALLERVEVDVELVEGQVAADHPDRPAAKRGHVREHLQPVQLAQRVGYGALIQTAEREQLAGMARDHLVPPRPHELLDRLEHAPADLGLLGQQLDQRRQVAVESHGRLVLRSHQPFQHAGRFE